jgi:hypothetical protein
MSRASLKKEACGGPHGKTSISNLIFLETRNFRRISLAETKGIKFEVTGLTVTSLTASGGGDSGDRFDQHNHDQAECNVLGVGVPDLPEGICLAWIGGRLASRSGSKDLDPDEANHCQHGKTAVLKLGLTEPVEINTNIVNVGQTEGVKANISCH